MDVNLLLNKINNFNKQIKLFDFEIAPNYKKYIKNLPYDAQSLFYLFRYIKYNQNKILELKEYDYCQNLGDCYKVMQIIDEDVKYNGDWVYSESKNKYYFVNFSFLSNPKIHKYSREAESIKDIIKEEFFISI